MRNRPDVLDIYPWKALPQVHPDRIAAVVDLTALQAVEGYLWCDKHGEVHGNTLNPYGYSNDASNDFCTDDDHRALYMEPDDMPSKTTSYRCDCDCHLPRGWRWKEGDPRPMNFRPCAKCDNVRHMAWDEREPIEPMPIRSSPVPLTVRRHTPESRDIFWKNLYDAMPADMEHEDRAHITTALLEHAIEHGDQLRRKRLIDKLVNAAQEMSSWDMNIHPPFNEWSDLLDDAAEEIRSVL